MFVKRRENINTVSDVVSANVGMPVETFCKEVRDPFIFGLKEAVDLTNRYLEKHPKGPVTIVGDYDSDGINATAIMFWAFMRKGVAPKLRLPHRFSEGYGLSAKIIDEIDSGLLITVDNGIAAASAVKKAKDKGLTVIVTDHHLPPVDSNGNLILPEADVIVDPHVYPEKSEFEDYCGAALAYRFARALLPDMKLKDLLVLASIATVTDVMPLIGANRTLVRDGLQLINKRHVVPGLNVLLQKLELDDHIDEGDYGFKIGPTFNASGRLYDNGAEKVLGVLCMKRNDPKIPWKADTLVKTNEKRKAIVKKSLFVAKQLLKATDERPIVIYDPSFSEGIVGIIAGQLCEQYQCPAIVFTNSDKPGILKGSGRSTSEVHLKNALDKVQEWMVGYGGHAGAAGLSIRKDNLEKFSKAFRNAVVPLPDHTNDDIPYDLDLDLNHIEEIMAELNSLAPFGEGNPRPVFRLVYEPINEPRRIGDGTHVMIKDEALTLMGFDMANQICKFCETYPHTAMDMIGYLSESWFNGNKSYKFEILAFDKAD